MIWGMPAMQSLWRLRSIPDNEAPVSVGFDAMLARNEDVGAFVSGLQVHRNGVRFTVEVRTRKPLFENGDLHSPVHGEGRAALQLGVKLADGRRCVHDWQGFRRRERCGAVALGASRPATEAGGLGAGDS
jgi:hypothetical protein